MSWLQFDQQHNDAAFTLAALQNASSAIVAATVAAAATASSNPLHEAISDTTSTTTTTTNNLNAAADSLTTLVLNILRVLWFCLLYHWYRQWLNGRSFTDRSRRLDGRVCIVTGANTGIGLYTADELVERGAHVVLACRDLERGEAAKRWICERRVGKTTKYADVEARVRVEKLDLADMRSVREFSHQFLRDDTRLDVLVNNAGVMAVPTNCSTIDGFEPHMGINHYGTFLLTLLLIDRMRRTANRDASVAVDGHTPCCHAVRIVNVVSSCHRWVSGDRAQLEAGISVDNRLDRFRAYAVSKLAGMMATRALAQRLGRHGVTVNAVHPGVVHTEIPRHLGRFSWVLNRHVCGLFSWLFLRTPQSGAQSVIYAAVDMNLDYITGQYISNVWFEESNPVVEDAAEMEWFWRHSEGVVGLTFEEACGQ